ncbi:hypothetical protein P4O66_012008 [Electrophorus voltai]|uniref:Uncharacterized protein n=1 Tax=Electrophorus voltai TaxID=2609070 RepID=A0AAD9DTR3_9TELE|nr:hypothetical protein P4O66_012008 [Electrophorus voltai]
MLTRSQEISEPQFRSDEGHGRCRGRSQDRLRDIGGARIHESMGGRSQLVEEERRWDPGMAEMKPEYTSAASHAGPAQRKADENTQ